MKRILIACEYSGIVREAFRKKGFDAYSCDFLPSDIPGQHLQGNALDFLHLGWNALIAFPPCTYLSSAGLHFCRIEMHGEKAIQRIKARNKAIEFFLDLWNAPINHICIENPLGHISSSILKPTQIIHPFYFGERQLKRTALWLKNLPPLQYRMQNDLFGTATASARPEPFQVQLRKSNGKIKYRHFTDCFVNNHLKTPHEKSRTFQAIADAMANQWSQVI